MSQGLSCRPWGELSGQLENWKRYLDDNPRRLAIKRQHPDFFTIIQNINIGEWSCQAVGNSFLLSD